MLGIDGEYTIDGVKINVALFPLVGHLFQTYAMIYVGSFAAYTLGQHELPRQLELSPISPWI